MIKTKRDFYNDWAWCFTSRPPFDKYYVSLTFLNLKSKEVKGLYTNCYGK